MLENPKPFITVLALALLAAAGCYNFDEVFDDCVAAGRCKPTVCDPSAADAPDDLFFDNNCDGLDGTPSEALFVDPAAGQDSNPGTREAPLKHLSFAMKAAASQGKVLYLARGTYDEADLRMDKPVSLYGGYSGVDGNWQRGADNVAQIGGGSIGLTVSGLGDAGVTIEWVRIGSTPDATPGGPSIGLRVMDSQAVRLRHVEVAAAAGTTGAVGDSPAVNPTVGTDGGVGESPTDKSSVAAKGGAGGALSCGPGSYAGGKGGQGAYFGSNATAGETGQPDAGGGDAGTNQELTDCSGTSLCECIGVPGGNGQPGALGGNGKDGTPGDGTGKLEGDTWVALYGQPGDPGTVGKAGGGGGGGGYCGENSFQTYSKGAAGGGGGAGGCPGVGAGGGQGGGASIAVLLLRAHVDLESSVLKTAGGGQGGRGGTGGPGSEGGAGGTGGTGLRDEYVAGKMISTGGKGGDGGKGGKGGNGGHGGNGGGGPSVGVWCGSEASVSLQGTTFGLGDPGAAGKGASLQGNPGLLSNSYACTPPL